MAGNPDPAPGGNRSSGPGMWGAVVVLAGLAGVVAVFFGALAHFTDAKDIVAVTGAITGVVGTIVTAFFGIHATASAGADATQKVADAGAAATARVAGVGQQAADHLAAVQKDAHDKSIALATYIDSSRAEEVVNKLGLQTGQPGPSQAEGAAGPAPAEGAAGPA
jgi:hypothetical protein